MAGRQVAINPKKSIIAQAALLEANAFVWRRTQDIVRSKQRVGVFPKAEAEYDLFLTSKGKTSKRNPATIPSSFPFLNANYRYAFQRNTTNKVADAVDAALALFGRRAVVRTGKYRNSLTIALNGKTVRSATIRAFDEKFGLKKQDVVLLAPVVEYASTLENNVRGGILFWVYKQLREQFKEAVSVKFFYVSGKELKQEWVYAVPVLAIGIAGAFPNSAVLPGSRSRQKRKNAGTYKSKVRRVRRR